MNPIRPRAVNAGAARAVRAPELPRGSPRSAPASRFEPASATAESVFGGKVVKLERVPTDVDLPGHPRYFVRGPFTVSEGFAGSAPRTFAAAFLGVEVPEAIAAAAAHGASVYLRARACAVKPIFSEVGPSAGELLVITEVHELSAMAQPSRGGPT